MNNLYIQLQAARSEEDVKDAYIAALGLAKNISKNLIDIQTDEIWFEAKHKPTDVYTMFTQLLYYVCYAHKKGEIIAPLLCVIDNEKAALMSTANITPIFKDKKITWGKSASKVSRELINQVSPYINDHFIVYHIKDDCEAFIEAVHKSIAHGSIIRTPITPDNLKKVFDRWMELIGAELEDLPRPGDYALLFYADIMHDGKKSVIQKDLQARLLIEDGKPVFLLHGKLLELASIKGYREFWNIYHRPPAEEYRRYLLERRDSLIPVDERQFKGAYYTPLKVVDKAYDLLSATLGKNWQKNYIVWDMCCGVGNLEAKHANQRNLFMSTLEQDDLNVMQTGGHFPAAIRFQYDYLNDDIAENGCIDYNLSNKIPQELRDIIQAARTDDKKSKILVLINPPYAEATTSGTVNGTGKNKAGVADTRFAKYSMAEYGKASNELFTQFLARIKNELPNATVAVFSTLKYLLSPSFSSFREQWNFEFKNGFLVHSQSFDDLNGDFPIGFLIWDLSKHHPQTHFTLPAYKADVTPYGEKQFSIKTPDRLLNKWIKRPRANKDTVIPLSNALQPYSASAKTFLNHWADGALAYLTLKGNDIQNVAKGTHIMSSTYGNGHGMYVTPQNLEKAAIVFAVRRLVKPTWLNDRDQFLQPHFGHNNGTECIPTEFALDCLIYMLFSNSNLTAGTAADALIWNGKKWQLTNHFIPFPEQEIGAKKRFSSHFMIDYLANKTLSTQAQAVSDAGRELWRNFYQIDIERKIRDKYLLKNADAGWYQVRHALKEAAPDICFSTFEDSYAALTDKLQPLVYEYGFLEN